MALVRASIVIDAPAERIWQILLDFERYGEWNPFTPRVESTLQPGAPVHLHVRLRGERLSHRVEYVTAVEPERRLAWRMQLGPRFLLAAERRQLLEPAGAGQTCYVSEDEITGWLTPLVMRLFGVAMQRGFEDVAQALKKRAES